jgi:ribosomal protein S10
MIGLCVKSLDRNSILLYKAFIISLLTKLNVQFSVIHIPRRKIRITLLKSPHVNKKSREQFQFTGHKVMFRIITELNVSILKYIVLNKPKTTKIALFKF